MTKTFASETCLPVILHQNIKMTKPATIKLELPKTEAELPCHHPFLKTDRKTLDKICTSCGRIVYSIKP
jgi:hypothetical protein